MKPFDFANDSALPAALAGRMQAIANARAAQGLISPDGQTHKTAAARDLYNAGVSPFSAEYMRAAWGDGPGR